MPTRRTFELIIITIMLTKPALAMVHLWANKAFQDAQPGTVKHGAAEIITVVSQ